MYRSLHSSTASYRTSLNLPELTTAEHYGNLQRLHRLSVFGETRIVFDSPEKIAGNATDNAAEVAVDLVAQAEMTSQELLIASPYFIPGENGGGLLAGLSERGVSINVLTNSLAATDHLSSFSGFSRYRKRVLENGIDLFELKPDLKQVVREERISGSTSNGGIHAKAYVFDRQRVFIGSFNLDPRSININTEIGLLVESEALAQQLADYFLSLADQEYSWQVDLNDSGKLIWIDGGSQGPAVYNSDPQASTWRKIGNNLFRLLPIEKHL